MPDQGCAHIDAIASKHPQRRECEDCVKTDGSWMHLRTCQECGVRVVATALQTVTPRSTRGRRSFGHRVGRAWRALAYCYPDDAFAAHRQSVDGGGEKSVVDTFV